jgi:hypothetical protein
MSTLNINGRDHTVDVDPAKVNDECEAKVNQMRASRVLNVCSRNRRCRRPSAARSGQHGAQPPDSAEQLVLVPVRIRQAKVAAMRAHAAALRPCRDLRNSTAEQPGNRGLKRFQYPVVVRGSNPVEIEANDSKVLEVLTPESEHWRGLQLDPNHRLLIRRSLVRA